MSNENYPMCQKLSMVRNDKAILQCFFEWLEENDLAICQTVQKEWHKEYSALREPTDKLLMEYFGIDEAQLEKERQKILKEQRKLNKEKT